MENYDIKIVLVDDHAIFRSGLKSLIEQENIGKVIADFGNGQDFINAIDQISPDLILMDIDMPIMNGVEACLQALKKNNNLKILILSMYADYSHYATLLNAGVKGFISKSSGKPELEKGIKAVLSGENYFSTDLLKNIIIDLNKPKSIQGKPLFTPRELDILKLLCNGFETTEIANTLYLSSKTIDNQRSKMLHKIGAKNSVSLVIYAIKNKYIVFD